MDQSKDQNVPQNPTPHQQGRHGHGFGRRGEYQHQKNYQMTDAERRVLKDCQSESFWYRALPFAVGAGILTQAMIKRGTLTVNSRFGALPKIAFGCLTGYMAGKISYVRKCKEKFLKLENSPISEMLRKGGSMPPGPAGSLLQIPGYQSRDSDQDNEAVPEARSETFSGMGKVDDYHSNLDIDTSNVKNMDNNNYDFDLVSESEPGIEAKRSEMTKTYDDLRKENRQQHASQYTQAMPGHYQPRQATPPPRSHDDRGKQQRVDDALPFASKQNKTNKYGDEME